MVEDATIVITLVVGCDKNVEAFRRVDGASILIDLVVRGSRRARGNAIGVLLNIVKSDEDKEMKDVREVDRNETTMRTLVDDDSRVSTRGKSKAEVLLSVLESKWGSQL